MRSGTCGLMSKTVFIPNFFQIAYQTITTIIDLLKSMDGKIIFAAIATRRRFMTRTTDYWKDEGSNKRRQFLLCIFQFKETNGESTRDHRRSSNSFQFLLIGYNNDGTNHGSNRYRASNHTAKGQIQRDGFDIVSFQFFDEHPYHDREIRPSLYPNLLKNKAPEILGQK